MTEPEKEKLILGVIADKKSLQKDVAEKYAFLIKNRKPRNATNFAKINKVIAARWSRARLIKIKEMAWKIVEGEDEGSSVKADPQNAGKL